MIATLSMQPAGRATGAPPTTEVVVDTAFDAAQGQLPEGVALDGAGNRYVGLGAPFFVPGAPGSIVKIGRDGEVETLVDFPTGPTPAGLAIVDDDRLFAAVPDPFGTSAGVYEIADGTARRLDGTASMAVPNGLATRGGDVFATDSFPGQIWRIPTDGGTATPWATDELLAGCDDIGANGIAFWRGDVYVANSSRGAVVRIPVDRSGTPGEPSVVAGDVDCDPSDRLAGIDGIAFDVQGRIVAALVLSHELVRLDLRSGEVTTLLTADDGLWNPASVAFGAAGPERRSLFVTNYGVIPPAPAASLGPALLDVSMGVPGLRQPAAVRGAPDQPR